VPSRNSISSYCKVKTPFGYREKKEREQEKAWRLVLCHFLANQAKKKKKIRKWKGKKTNKKTEKNFRQKGRKRTEREGKKEIENEQRERSYCLEQRNRSEKP